MCRLLRLEAIDMIQYEVVLIWPFGFYVFGRVVLLSFVASSQQEAWRRESARQHLCLRPRVSNSFTGAAASERTAVGYLLSSSLGDGASGRMSADRAWRDPAAAGGPGTARNPPQRKQLCFPRRCAGAGGAGALRLASGCLAHARCVPPGLFSVREPSCSYNLCNSCRVPPVKRERKKRKEKETEKEKEKEKEKETDRKSG